MGTTYYPNNRKIEEFDVNSAGRILLGLVFREAELPLSNTGHAEFDYNYPRIPYVMDSDAAKECSQKLRAAIVNIPDTLTKVIEDGGWGEGPKEFLQWLSSLADFLENCGGYDTDPE